jgi:hypothetical protein
MTTQISTKLAALGMALTLNGVMLGGVAYLFNGKLPRGSISTALVGNPLPASSPAAA